MFYRHHPPGTSIQSFIGQAPQTTPNAAMPTGQSRASSSYVDYRQQHGQQYHPGAHVGDSYVIRREEATLFDQNLQYLNQGCDSDYQEGYYYLNNAQMQ